MSTSNLQECKNSGLLKVLTRTSTVREQVAFTHNQRVWGLICRVYFPVDGTYDPYTREGSLYNREDNKYRYKAEPDIPCINLVFSNLMDLTRMDAATRMDALQMKGDIYAFTNYVQRDETNESWICGIPVNSKILVEYNFKEFAFFVWAITALDSPHEIDGKAVFKLELKPHV